MCHFLPVYHLGIVFLGWVVGQNITIRPTLPTKLSTNNSIQHYSFVRTWFNGFKYCYTILTIQYDISYSFVQLNGLMHYKAIVGTLAGTLTPDQIEFGYNGNK